MLKKLLYFSLIVFTAISVNFITSFLKAFLDTPMEEVLEAKGYETTQKELPTSGSPLDYTSEDNIAFIAYYVANNDFSSSTSGTVSGSVAGISQTQQVVNRRYVNGNNYLVETSSQGILSFATQKFFNSENQLVLIRDANNPSDLSLGYKADTPKALSFKGYQNIYGWLPKQLASYTICDATILQISDVKSLTDGNYEITISLDPQYGVYYYRYEVRSNAGVSEFPIFSDVNLTITFTKDWVLKSINSKESYRNKAPGMNLWVSCTGDLTEEFTFKDKAEAIPNTTKEFFLNYQDLTPNDDAGLIVKDSDGFDYLMQSFSPYLTEPATFDIKLSLDYRKFNFKFYLDLKNNIYGLLNDDFAFIYYNDKPLIRLFNKNFQFNLAGFDPSAVSNFDFNSLTTSIISSLKEGRIRKVNNLIHVNSTIELFGIKVPVYFNYVETKHGVRFDDLGVNTTLFASDLRFSFEPSETALNSDYINNLTNDLLNNPTYTFDLASLSSLLANSPSLGDFNLADYNTEANYPLFSTFLHYFIDVLSEKRLSLKFAYRDQDLNIASNIYVDLARDFSVFVKANIKYKQLTFDATVLFENGYVYLSAFNQTLKLSLREIKDLLTFDSVDLKEIIDFNFTSLLTKPLFTFDKDTSTLTLDIFNQLLNFNFYKINNEPTFSSDKIDLVFGFDAVDFTVPDTNLLTYNDIKEFKPLLEYAINNRQLLFFFKDFAIDLLIKKELYLDLHYKKENFELSTEIYANIFDNLYFAGNLALEINNFYTLNLKFFFKDNEFYFESKNHTLTFTVNDVLKLMERINKKETNFDVIQLTDLFTYDLSADQLDLHLDLTSLLPDLKLDLTILKTEDKLLINSFDKSFNLKVFLNPPVVIDYHTRKSLTNLDLGFVHRVLDLVDDVTYYLKQDILSFAFNLKHDQFIIDGTLSLDLKNKRLRANFVLNDLKNKQFAYFDFLYLDNYFYLSYRSDLNSNKNLSVKFTLKDAKYLLNRLINDLDADLFSMIGNLPDRDTHKYDKLDLEDLFTSLLYRHYDIVGLIFKEHFTTDRYTLEVNFYKSHLPYNSDLAYGGRYGGICGLVYNHSDFELNFDFKLTNNHLSNFTPPRYKFYDLKDLLPAIDAAINTFNLREWRVTGSAKLAFYLKALDIKFINLDLGAEIKYDITVKLPKGELEPIYDAYFYIPVKLFINNDVPYKFGDTNGGYDRVLHVYHKKGLTVFRRTEKIGRFALFTKTTHHPFTRIYTLTDDQLERNALDAFLKYGIGLKDDIMKQIKEAIDENSSKVVDPADAIRDITYNQSKTNYIFKLNPANLLKDSKMTLLDINLNIFRGMFDAGSAILEISPAKAIYISITSNNIRFVDNGRPHNFSSDYYYYTGSGSTTPGVVYQGRWNDRSRVATLY